MSDLEASLVVETKISQWLPIVCRHLRGCGTELLSQFAQRPLTRRQVVQLPPAPLPNGRGQCIVTVLDTRELSVGRRSIEAFLGRRRHRRHHLPLGAAEHARVEHHRLEMGSE